MSRLFLSRNIEGGYGRGRRFHASSPAEQQPQWARDVYHLLNMVTRGRNDENELTENYRDFANRSA
jgi:hypothetical protein